MLVPLLAWARELGISGGQAVNVNFVRTRTTADLAPAQAGFSSRILLAPGASAQDSETF